MLTNISHLKFLQEEWSAFFCELGYLFYENTQLINNKGFLNIAINVPFKKGISLSLAVGMAHSVYSKNLVKNENDTEWIKSIQPNTLVFYTPNENIAEKSYVFKGLSESGLPILKGMGINKGIRMTLSKTESWRNIRIAPEQNKYKRQRTLQSDVGLEKLYERYDIDAIKQLFNKGTPYFLIIGNENSIREDMYNNAIDKGLSMQDFLRIKKFGGKQYSFISEFFSNAHEDSNEMIFKSKEIPIIIDGASSYLRYYEMKENIPKIIIFSRDSPLDTTVEALDKMENSFITGNIIRDDEILKEIMALKPPSNIEIMCWRELYDY
jgi:hypothetical protein